MLVVDLHPATELADALSALPRARSHLEIDLVQEPAAGGEPGDLAAGHRFEATFLALPPDHLPAAALSWVAALAGQGPIFAVTAADDPDCLLELLRCGLTDFIRPPLTAAGVLPRLWRALEQTRSRPQRKLTRRFKEKVGLEGLVGVSPAFTAQTEKIPLVARCDAGVLISGETGTGKELFARAIHYLSPRSGRPFVPVNCGAIPVDLVENELFGHERSAFTGAHGARAGLIEEADGGTLFLDEIDGLPLVAQVKLLRFLQEKELRRLGSTRIRRCDVRVIAATNADVETALERGRLRRDLYYRLNVVPLALPPLRRRPEDVPLLARHFLARYGAELGRPAAELSDEAMHALLVHDWPGNVRELEHVVQRALVLSQERSRLGLEGCLLPTSEPGSGPMSFREAKARVVARFEKGYLERSLAAHDGNISRAARASQKNRRAFFELIKKHGIDVERFRSGPRS